MTICVILDNSDNSLYKHREIKIDESEDFIYEGIQGNIKTT